jgi:hypothetical protein
MTKLILSITASLLFLSASSPFAQPLERLNGSQINEALELGRTADPKPYPLRHLDPTGKNRGAVIGAIYTPFIRVAIASRDATIRGVALTQDTLDPAILDPVVYVAFKSSCCFVAPSDAQFKLVTPEDAERVPLPRFPGSVPKLRITAPIATYVAGQMDRILEIFGERQQLDELILVAAYPLEALLKLDDFVIYRDEGFPSNEFKNWTC